MGILLNGTSQYVSMGNGVNIANTRPISFAVLYDSTSLRTAGNYGGLLSQGRTWYGSGSGGWAFLIEAAAAPRLEIGWNANGASGGSIHSTFTTTPNTGVHLAAGVIYDNGANTRFRMYHYRYSNGTFQAEAADVPSVAGDVNVGSSNVADPFIVGAGWTGAAGEDFFPGTILWAAVFSHDIGVSAGTTLATLPQLSHLIFQGPWAMLDRCVGFWSFQHGHAIDLSRNATRRNGTLVGSPSYSYAVSKVVTGTPPGGVWRIVRGPAGGGGGPVTVDLTSLPATAAGTAVTPTTIQASLTLDLSGVVASAASSAVSPTVTLSGGGVTVNVSSLPASAAGSAVDPTVRQASLTINATAAPASASGTAITPSVAQGSLSVNLTAAPATASGSATSPTVRQASLTLNLSSAVATATSSAVTPTVTLGGGGLTVNLSAVPASAAGSAVTPSVRQSSLGVAPEPAEAVASAITPTVRQGSLSVDLTSLPALAIGTALTPTTIVAAAAARATGLASGRRLLWPMTAARVTTRPVLSGRLATRPSLTARPTTRPATSGRAQADTTLSGSEHW